MTSDPTLNVYQFAIARVAAQLKQKPGPLTEQELETLMICGERMRDYTERNGFKGKQLAMPAVLRPANRRPRAR